MANRLSVEEKLAVIRQFRGQTLLPENQVEIRKFIGDRSNFVVAAAAEIAGDNTLVELAKDLEAALDRFLLDPVKNDKLCRAKLAIVKALDKMEHAGLAVFETAAKHVQLEPAWGKPEDTAVPLRAAAIIAIARIEGSTALPLLIDAMIDPARDVRIAAAVALGAIGTDAASYLLRLKARIGDADSEVLSECLSGLLMANPRDNLAFVCEFLDPANESGCEAAALALGKSRLPEAVDPLKACWSRSRSLELRQQVLLAIAMLRLPAAIDYLLELVGSDSEPAATSALSALKIYNYDSRLRERIAKIVDEGENLALKLAFDRGFPLDKRS